MEQKRFKLKDLKLDVARQQYADVQQAWKRLPAWKRLLTALYAVFKLPMTLLVIAVMPLALGLFWTFPGLLSAYRHVRKFRRPDTAQQSPSDLPTMFVYLTLLLLIVRSAGAKRLEAEGADGPPTLATYMLYLCLSKQNADAMQGDLDEGYRDMEVRFGRRRAQVWYWKEVAVSVWPLLNNLVDKLVRWGIGGWIADLFRRKLS